MLACCRPLTSPSVQWACFRQLQPKVSTANNQRDPSTSKSRNSSTRSTKNETDIIPLTRRSSLDSASNVVNNRIYRPRANSSASATFFESSMSPQCARPRRPSFTNRSPSFGADVSRRSDPIDGRRVLLADTMRLKGSPAGTGDGAESDDSARIDSSPQSLRPPNVPLKSPLVPAHLPAESPASPPGSTVAMQTASRRQLPAHTQSEPAIAEILSLMRVMLENQREDQTANLDWQADLTAALQGLTSQVNDLSRAIGEANKSQGRWL